MADLTALDGLQNNTGLIEDPESFAREAHAKSWLYLCGEAFASMEGGMSYADVQAAVDDSVNIVSDPPVVMDMDLARRHIAALDELPRPTLVTCRTGPRSSAVMYLYAGLKVGASAEEVLAARRSGRRVVHEDGRVRGVGQAGSRRARLTRSVRLDAAQRHARPAARGHRPACFDQANHSAAVPRERRQQFEHAGVVAARFAGKRPRDCVRKVVIAHADGVGIAERDDGDLGRGPWSDTRDA